MKKIVFVCKINLGLDPDPDWIRKNSASAWIPTDLAIFLDLDAATSEPEL
jgi:hypothetical protein